MTIFGREPAVWLALIGAILTTIVATQVSWLSAGAEAAIMGALTAIVIAVTTRPIAPALFTAAFVALAAVFAQYGLHLSDDLVAGISSVILAAFALAGIRPQVTPTTGKALTR